MEVGLLDYLTLKASPTLLSDLPLRPGLCLHAVLFTEAGLFDVGEWNRAGAYLSAGYVPQEDPAAAKAALIEALAQRDGLAARAARA